LGYGNQNADTWFIGCEEGGAEIWRRPPSSIAKKSEKDRTLWSLAIRSSFTPAMDFQQVWKELYQYGNQFDSLVSGRNNVWRYIAAFHLYNSGNAFFDSTSDKVDVAITDLLKTDFGTIEGRFFFAEFLPLPRIDRNAFSSLYRQVWPSVSSYKIEVVPKRFYLIMKAIEESNTVKQIVSFSTEFFDRFVQTYPVNSDGESKFPTKLLKEWSSADGKRFRLFSVKLASGRTIRFLQAPFFGWMGYGPAWYARKGLPYAAAVLKNAID
jgi:hypothetical protein